MYKQISKATMKKHVARLSKELVTKSDINALGKLMNSLRFSEFERRDQIHALMNDNLKDSYKITQEQTEVGIDWLMKNIVNERTGRLRENKLAQDFFERERNIILNFSHFEFVGFEEHANMYSSYYTPIYRTVAKNGQYFDYTAIHWGPCMIVNRGHYPTKLEQALA
jgi:hypothetical protein